MTSGVVVAQTLCDDLSGRALDHIKDVVTSWFHDVSRGKRRSDHIRLLVKLGSGPACALAQPFKNGAALRDRWMHGRSSTGLRLFVSTQALRCLPMGAQWSADE